MAAFSRKHYQIIAAAIAAQRAELSCEPGTLDALNALTDELARQFAQDNPRFDAERFARAAGHSPNAPGTRGGR